MLAANLAAHYHSRDTPWSWRESMHARSLLLIVMMLAGCNEHTPPVNGCVPVGDMQPTCGFMRPEDMVLLPDGRTLLISQTGSLGGEVAGSFALFDTVNETITRLPAPALADGPLWGDHACDQAPGAAFSPHGIDLARRADGHWQVLAVNHGGRESVEFFQLVDASEGWRLAWRGCAIPDPDSMLNDVAALPDGGFVVTHMYSRHSPHMGLLNLALVEGVLGFDTGHVLHWDGQHFTALAGTAMAYPNGIQVARDGSALFVNAYLTGEVRKIAYPDGRLLGKVAVQRPDNSQWDATGRLLVASHGGAPLEVLDCLAITEGACGLPFAIVAVDPQTLERHTVLEHRGPPMGAATVAQQVDGYLYLGSFAGDRIVRVPLPAP